MSDLSVTEIKGFLPSYEKEYAIATRAVQKDDGDQIFVVFLFKNEFNFCYYVKGREPDNYLISDLFTESNISIFPL